MHSHAFLTWPDTSSACYAAQFIWAAFFRGGKRCAAADTSMSTLRIFTVIIALLIAAGCASGPSSPPYPAFVVSDELPDMFMASLPGIRAKQFNGNAETRATSSRIDLPADWSGTTGASPGKALEVFVLDGELRLADMTLRRGGYAFLPPGSLGFNLHTDNGARILYFLDDLAGNAMIRTPMILDSGLVEWQATDTIGVLSKDLRVDPGSGARTWLLRIEPGAQLPWQSTSVVREGYLVAGQFQDSECVDGEPYTEIYTAGGYFNRPADVVSGGPAASALTESVWLLRESSSSVINADVVCAPN